MPQPIYLPKEQGLFDYIQPMIQQMFMMKFKHNMDMDVLDAETKLETAKLKEKRQYQEGQKGKVQKQKYIDEGRPQIIGPRARQPGEVTNVQTGNRWGAIPMPKVSEGFETFNVAGRPVVRARRIPKKEQGPTFSKIEGQAFTKYGEGGYDSLTQLQKKIVDKRLKKSGQDPDDVYAKSMARHSAWASGFKQYVGRDPSKNEARRHFLNDIYGILEPDEEETTNAGVSQKLPGESVADYLKRMPK